MAIAKGQLAQPVQSRLFCCQILGKTATKFEPFVWVFLCEYDYSAFVWRLLLYEYSSFAWLCL